MDELWVNAAVVGFGQHTALGVPGIGAKPKAQCAAIDLFAASHEKGR